MLSKNDEALDLLERAISQGKPFKVKAKNLNCLKNYLIIPDFKNQSLDYSQCGISRYSSILSFRKIFKSAFA